MKKFFQTVICSCVIACVPLLAEAHQPRIVTGRVTEVRDPEISQAFYGELKGAPDEFIIRSDKDFRLYVGLLVPDVKDVRKDISADISVRTAQGERRVELLDGASFAWTPYFEEFAKDNYFWGPEFSAPDSQRGVELKGKTMPAGTYKIVISDAGNQGRYSLAIGDVESFSPKEMLNAALILPRIKAQFFDRTPLDILGSPYGWGNILGLYILAFAFGLIYRALLRKFAKRKPYTVSKNIGSPDRWIRAGLGLALLIFAIATTWNPIVIFASGFCVFEAIFSWCGLYAAVGKNTCPLN